MGTAICFASKGASVGVADILPNRLEKVLLVDTNASINSADKDVLDQIKVTYGVVPGFMGQGEARYRRVPRRCRRACSKCPGVEGQRNRGILKIVALHKRPGRA